MNSLFVAWDMDGKPLDQRIKQNSVPEKLHAYIVFNYNSACVATAHS